LRAPLAPIMLCCTLVLSLEIVNTALEALTDLASPEIHPLAKVAKDAGAGAVLIASCGALLVGLVVLGPPLWGAVSGGW
ncbi:diacylglycerol kinase family protein, partial [Deinococcus sp.]|uniref:diacylglycerol kinase family protein n=1 Tax=Deinococcus sp. TaxID=47478 RepID=UPI0025BFE79F